jgi:hypothetical protein
VIGKNSKPGVGIFTVFTNFYLVPKLKVTDKITCITPITGQRSTVTVSKIFKSATRPVVLELAGHQVQDFTILFKGEPR